MADPLYTKDILRLAADIPLLERLEAADVSVTKVSPICGSRVKVDVAVEDGQIAQYGQEVRACALGQAAAAIMGQNIIGTPLAHFPPLLEALTLFLKGEGPVPAAPWDMLQIFAPAKAHKSRHASILLTYQALAQIAQNMQTQGALQ